MFQNLNHQPSGSNQSEVKELVVSTQLSSSTWWGFQYMQNNSRIWLRILPLALGEELN